VNSATVDSLGLRSLAPEAPGYAPRYERCARARQRLPPGERLALALGPFVEAWVRVNGESDDASARYEHVSSSDMEHLTTLARSYLKIADADPPHAPRGCPFQAGRLERCSLTDCSCAPERKESDASLARERI